MDLRHPDAMGFLRQDLDRIRTFFNSKGVKTLRLEDAVEFVVDDFGNGGGHPLGKPVRKKRPPMDPVMD